MEAARKSAGKAGTRRMAMTSAAPKRIAASKKSDPKKKKPAPAKKAAVVSAKKPAPAKKPATPAAKPAPAPPRLATPIPSPGQAPRPAAAAPARPATQPAARPAAPSSAEERRKAATRKFFARLRSLEAIVGADLRKRGSLVLMQAVDQWYSEAINVNATDVSITNAAKAVIAHL